VFTLLLSLLGYQQGGKAMDYENVNEHPFAPFIVKAVLYRGFCEFNGADFLTKKTRTLI